MNCTKNKFLACDAIKCLDLPPHLVSCSSSFRVSCVWHCVPANTCFKKNKTLAKLLQLKVAPNLVL